MEGKGHRRTVGGDVVRRGYVHVLDAMREARSGFFTAGETGVWGGGEPKGGLGASHGVRWR